MTKIDESKIFKYKLRNTFQTILLIMALLITLGLLGWLIGGGFIAFYAIVLVIILYFVNPVLSPQLILKMYRTQPIMPYQAPNLHAILKILAQRAELPFIPQLFYLPSDVMNAFAVGTPENSAIALSDGILRRLSPHEIAGVLAHEISHIMNADIQIMGFADLVSRLTNFLAWIGQVFLILNIFLLLFFGTYLISWFAIIILILAPIGTDLLQLALSRNREYDADLGATQLLGDPTPLVAALLKMERYQGRFWEQIWWPGQHSPEPSLLRTHPSTKERIKRLLELREHYYLNKWIKKPIPFQIDLPLSLFIAHTPLRPRWHINGIWF